VSTTGNTGHAHAARFLHGNSSALNRSRHRIGKLSHVLDASQILNTLISRQPGGFFFSKFSMRPVQSWLQQLQPLDGLLQGRPVGQRATRPRWFTNEGPHFLVLGDRFLRWRLVPTNKTVLPCPEGRLTKRLASRTSSGLLQVNNVDPVALAENIFFHLRIPAAPRLVDRNVLRPPTTFHGNFNCHFSSLVNSLLAELCAATFGG